MLSSPTLYAEGLQFISHSYLRKGSPEFSVRFNSLCILQGMYYALCAIFGVGYGILIANLLAVLHMFSGEDKLANLLGFHLMFEGIGGLVGTPLCGKPFSM